MKPHLWDVSSSELLPFNGRDIIFSLFLEYVSPVFITTSDFKTHIALFWIIITNILE